MTGDGNGWKTERKMNFIVAIISGRLTRKAERFALQKLTT